MLNNLVHITILIFWAIGISDSIATSHCLPLPPVQHTIISLFGGLWHYDYYLMQRALIMLVMALVLFKAEFALRCWISHR